MICGHGPCVVGLVLVKILLLRVSKIYSSILYPVNFDELKTKYN
jgi:hypothetical protein